MTRPPRCAVVHDGCLDTPGGAAKVSVELADVLDAGVYVGRTNCLDWYRERVPADLSVYAGSANRLPTTFRDMMVAYRTGKLHLPEYDVVVTSGVPAKFYQPESFQRHVHYTHHPPLRYMHWLGRGTLSGIGGNATYLLKKSGMYLDWLEMQRVDTVVANSRATAERIGSHYQRESTVITPPVRYPDGPVVAAEDREDQFLYAGRLGERKRLETLIRAFGRVDERLVITGSGPLEDRLRSVASDVDADVKFCGFVSEEQLGTLMRRSKGGVFLPKEEDFGMSIAELLCCGTPVIVSDEPNPSYMVTDERGVRVSPEVAAVAAALHEFDVETYDPTAIADGARAEFGVERFRKSIRDVIGSGSNSF